jgi:hypothetical protein
VYSLYNTLTHTLNKEMCFSRSVMLLFINKEK